MAKKITEEGYYTWENTLFFKECIAEYAGCELDPGGKRWGLEQNKLYNVYRPKAEVIKPEFVKTLNAKPILDDHTIIGNGKGFVKPEKKGTGGVLTEVKVVGNELRGRVDVWSTALQKKIDAGKVELSLSYACEFEKRSGVFEGQTYDFVQVNLQAGNHLAFVDEARNGHDCRVVDSAFVCDSKFQLEQSDMDWTKISADELIEGLKGCSDECKAKAKEFLNTPTEDEKKELEAKEAAEKEAAEKAKAEADAKVEAEKKEAVDAAVAEANKAAEAKAEEAKKEADAACEKACDAAVEEYKKAVALAEDCKAKFGVIAMDGVKTEQDLAVKVCAMDSAPNFLKSVKPESAIVALKGCLAGSGVVTKKQTRVGDGKSTKSIADFIG